MVGVSYDSVRGLVVAVRVCIRPTVIPGGIWGPTRVWHSEARRGVCVPLPKCADHSLLRNPKSRSRTLDGGSAVKVVHRLGRRVWH
jgi:hypothetical protein